MGKVYDGIMGFVVGDALGVPVEFQIRDSFEITDMIGGGSHKQPAGTWSDDSSMTLATLKSIEEIGYVRLHDLMNKFVKWIENHEFTPNGKVFDVGQTTFRSIVNYMKGTSLQNCGGRKVSDNGNGALMRMLPIALYIHTKKNVQDKINIVLNAASITHNHIISHIACVIYSLMADNILKSMHPFQALSNAVYVARIFFENIPEWKEYENILNVPLRSRNEIKSSGYVVDTLESSIWCIFNTDTYKSCVLKAANLGGDTDTICAVSGGIAGIIYGLDEKTGIPQEWIDKIARKKWIKSLCDKMEEKIKIN